MKDNSIYWLRSQSICSRHVTIPITTETGQVSMTVKGLGIVEEELFPDEEEVLVKRCYWGLPSHVKKYQFQQAEYMFSVYKKLP